MHTIVTMLKREKHKVPLFITSAIEKNNLMKEYKNRPPYQQNDYIGWITRAKKEPTKQKRLQQMLNELKKGNVYMKMRWTSK